MLSAEQKATDYRSPDDGIIPDHRATSACTRYLFFFLLYIGCLCCFWLKPRSEAYAIQSSKCISAIDWFDSLEIPRKDLTNSHLSHRDA